ncbi:hypothetical protein EGW08_016040, partial [Elysia chlorotica]
VIGTWQDWQSWSACSGPCSGVQTRIRTCTEPALCSTPCQGKALEWRDCGDPFLCCVPREWTAWGSWGAWSHESRLNVRHRSRKCEPKEKVGGYKQFLCPEPCVGQEVERDTCSDSSWATWSPWSSCRDVAGLVDSDTNMPCGDQDAQRNRSRTCRRGTCGRNCVGDIEQFIPCQLKPCCEEPVWSGWSDWGQCSDDGVQHRKRMCQSDPTKWRSPTCERRSCQGQDSESQRCDACPDCEKREWSCWDEWSPCGSDQGQTRWYQVRYRSCGGDQWSGKPLCPEACPGDRKEAKECCTPSSWTSWTGWSVCSSYQGESDLDTGEPCGGGPGNQTRTRTCTQGTCGDPCIGDATEISTCYERPCCVPQVVTPWTEWLTCYGNPPKSRRQRTCTLAASAGDGPPCRSLKECDNTEDEKECLCEEPTWQEWTSWSDCDKLNTLTERTRRCRYATGNSRECLNQSHCQGKNRETKECPCTPSSWTPWVEWSECSTYTGETDPSTGEVCGGGEGTRNRTRTCAQGTCGDLCYGESTDYSPCYVKPCCVPSKWTAWGPYGECMHGDAKRDPDTGLLCTDDGKGCRTKTRTCIIGTCPEKFCEGDESHSEFDCDLSICCAPRVLSDWSPWEECSGFTLSTIRRRHCLSSQAKKEEEKEEEEGGERENIVIQPDCRLEDFCKEQNLREEKRCNCQEPQWQPWEPWGMCDLTFYPSVRTRTRRCDYGTSNDPECPKYPASCPGPYSERKNCQCDWETWSQWSSCDFSSRSVPIRTRTRRCSYQGADCDSCVGEGSEAKDCLCAKARLGHWTDWTECRETFDGRTVKTRVRRCDVPQNYGDECANAPATWRSCEGLGPRTERERCEFPITNECEGRENGKYASKKPGCKFYIQCCRGKATERECSAHKYFDSICQECISEPHTCYPKADGYNYDVYRDEKNADRLKRFKHGRCTHNFRITRSVC